jgi:hypothetical protein
MAAWPTLPEVRAFLRLQPDAAEDAIIENARQAAIDYGIARYGKVDDGTGTGTLVDRYPIDTTTLPATGHQAATMHAARLYRRRDSIDGTIWGGDAGAIRVGRIDPDIDALYAQHAPMVFG